VSRDGRERSIAEPRRRPLAGYRAPLRRAIRALQERAEIRLRRRGLPTDSRLDLGAAADLRELLDRLPAESSGKHRTARYLLGRGSAAEGEALPPTAGRTGRET